MTTRLKSSALSPRLRVIPPYFSRAGSYKQFSSLLAISGYLLCTLSGKSSWPLFWVLLVSLENLRCLLSNGTIFVIFGPMVKKILLREVKWFKLEFSKPYILSILAEQFIAKPRKIRQIRFFFFLIKSTNPFEPCCRGTYIVS